MPQIELLKILLDIYMDVGAHTKSKEHTENQHLLLSMSSENVISTPSVTELHILVYLFNYRAFYVFC